MGDLIDYINSIDNIIKSNPASKVSVFDPKINNGVINCFKIMNNYKEKEKKKEVPIPKSVSMKKHGDNSITTFKFDNVEIEAIETIVDDLKLSKVTVDTSDDGFTEIDIEK